MIFDFLLRMALFGISIFYLTEYIYVCKVPTYIGCVTALVAALITIGIYYYFRVKKMTRCSCCKRLWVPEKGSE